MQENNHLGYFVQKQKHRNTEKKNKTTKTKHMTKNTFCILTNHPLFCQNFVFSSCTLSRLQSCVLLKTLYSVFSRTQLLGITDSKAPFRGPFPKWHLCNQKCHFGFSPGPAETPIFIVFCHLEWPQKRTIFQKQIVATKMRVFTVRTQIVFAYF